MKFQSTQKKIENFLDKLSNSKHISNRIEIRMRTVKEFREREAW